MLLLTACLHKCAATVTTLESDTATSLSTYQREHALRTIWMICQDQPWGVGARTKISPVEQFRISMVRAQQIAHSPQAVGLWHT